MNEFIVVKEIGTGAFGRAYKAKPRIGSGTVVIKRIDLSILSIRQKSEAINEVNVLRELRHPYIIKHLANFIECGHLHIVMEFANSGDLGARIKETRAAGRNFSESQISRWLTQILLGLSFIHAKNIIHRDLKPQNLFLSTESDRLLIGDFGVCKVMDSKQDLARTMTGTPYYLSPEVFQSRPYSFKSDIWALGCILFEMASLSVAFDACDLRSLSLRVCRGSNPSFPVRYSSGLRSIFQAIMQRDHHSRPSAEALLARPFIKAISTQMTLEASTTKALHPRTPARSLSPAMKAYSSPRPPLYRKSENIAPSRLNVIRTPSPVPRRFSVPGRSLTPKPARLPGRSHSPYPVVSGSSTRPSGRSLTPKRTIYPPSPLKQRIVLYDFSSLSYCTPNIPSVQSSYVQFDLEESMEKQKSR